MVFLTVNAAVHTVMYFYYFLMEMGRKPSFALLLTICQIVQMVVGIAVISTVIFMVYVEDRNCQCENREAMMISAVVMYSTYLYLFCEVFPTFFSNLVNTIKSSLLGDISEGKTRNKMWNKADLFRK